MAPKEDSRRKTQEKEIIVVQELVNGPPGSPDGARKRRKSIAPAPKSPKQPTTSPIVNGVANGAATRSKVNGVANGTMNGVINGSPKGKMNGTANGIGSRGMLVVGK